MTSTIVPALKELKKFDKVNVVDVGAARASFLVELDPLSLLWCKIDMI